MKTCRICGAALPAKKCNQESQRIAELNLKHLPKRLEEEGEYMTDYQFKTTKRIIYESHLTLNNEFSWDEALCKSCMKKENEAWEGLNKHKGKEWIDLDALDRKSKLFQEGQMIENIIKKYLR